MKTDKKILKSASVLAGALLTTTLAATPAAGADILAYNDLGTGSQVRSHLIGINALEASGQEALAVKFGELKCGEGKCGEGTCGEGDKKEAKKAESKKTEATAESKSTETKSGDAEKKESTEKKKSDG